MILGEKQITLTWQQVEDETGSNSGEDSMVIDVWADATDGLGWTPISYATDCNGEIIDSTTFGDSLGAHFMRRAAAWFAGNTDFLINEDPDFAGYRQHLWAEREADRGWANRRSL